MTAPGRTTLRTAIRTGLLRCVGEQRFEYRAEQLDTMTSYVLGEVRRHQKSHPRTKPVGVGIHEEILLELLAAGRTVAQIAKQVQRPVAETSDDVRRLFQVLGAKDALGAVVAGYELGLLQPGRTAASR